MFNWFFETFNNSDFLPHSFCINSSGWLLILSVISNALVTIAYFSIPICLYQFIKKHSGIHSIKFTLWLFTAFIFACGTTHVLHIITYWRAWYWLQVFFDTITALVSIYTAIYLKKLLPKLLTMPSIEQLLKLNQQLESEIKERKTIEEALRQEINFSKTLIDSLPGVFYRLDEQARLVDWNNNLADLLGERGIFDAQSQVLNIIADEHKSLIADKIAEGFANGHVTVEADLKLANGKNHSFYFVAKTVSINNAKYLLGTGIDINTKKQAHLIEIEALERLQKIASRLPGVIYQYRLNADGSSCFPYASSAIKTIYRVTPQQVQHDASAVFSILHPDDYQQIVDTILLSARDLTPWKLEYRVQFDNGDIRWLSGNALPERESNGAVLWHGFITDISERKFNEQQLELNRNLLAESEKRFRTLADFAPVLIWIAGLDKLCYSFNKTWLDFTGKTLEQEQGNGWADGVHADDLQQCLDIYNDSFDARQPFKMEYRLKRYDGQYRWILDTGIPRFTEEGVFLGYIGSCIDITERKEIEDKLRTLSVAIEQSPASVVITDLNANLLYVNPRFTQVTGYSSEEALGKNPNMLQSGLTSKMIYDTLWDTVTHGDIWHGELINKRKDGDIYWEEAYISPVKDLAGKTTHYVGVKLDITERKHVEMRLQQSEENFRSTFEYAPIGIVNISLDGNYLAVNQTFCDFIGYSREELLTMNIMDITQKQDKETHKKLLQQLINGEIDNFSLEKCYIHKDGEDVWGSLSVRLSYHSDGSIHYMIASIEDITKRRQIQNEILKTKNQLEATLNAIPDLLFELDLEGRYYDYHAHRKELLATSPEFFLNKTIFEVMPSDVADICLSALYQAHEQGWSTGKQIQLNLADGIYWFELSVAPKLSNDNELPRFLVLSRDITERKQVEAQLKASHEKVRLLIEKLPLALALVSKEGQVLYINERFKLLFGYCLEEIATVEQWYLNAYPDATYREQVINLWTPAVEYAALNKTDIQPFEYIVTCKNGLQRIMLISGIFLEDNLLATFVDVTEQKQIEQILRESEARFKAIINTSPVPMALNNNQQQITFLNRAFIETFGYDLQDIPVLSEWWVKAYPDAHYRQWVIKIWQKTLAQTLEKNLPFTPLEIDICCKDNSHKTVLACAAFISHDVNEEYLVVLYDITQLKNTQLELLKKQQQLQHIISATKAGTWEWNIQTGEVIFNQGWANIIGYELAQLKPVIETWTNVCHPDDLKRSAQLLAKHFSNELAYYDCECRMKHKQGHWVWVLDRGQLISRTEDGRPLLMVGTHIDISQLKQTESELRIAATVFEAQEGMLITDVEGTVLRVNQAFTYITGYSPQEVIGKNPRILSSGEQNKEFYKQMWQSIKQKGSWQGELWNKRKNGERYAQWLTISAVKSDGNDTVTHYVATMTDITERKSTEEYIHRLAFYDPLTQLANRRLLKQRLQEAIEHSIRTNKKTVLLMLDLDKFKAVNDTLGHAAGDELLKQVAVRIKHCLREMDLIARLGGDEFVILIEAIRQPEHITQIASNIIKHLKEKFILNGNHEAHIGTSIGIAIYPDDADNIDLLMDYADTALYHAKDKGRGCFVYFSQELMQKAREKLTLEKRLRQAIENQELRVYFQPQIEVETNQLMGAEVLVRWLDPIKGLLMPKDFISLAEETGLIVELGEWVLRKSCELGKQWQDLGLPKITLAINISAYQFRRCDIYALVEAILKETGFAAEYLELEITESGLMGNQNSAMLILSRLHDLGVRLAIDDFGTGYSSFAYLKYFPLDILKIDKTFIDDIPFSEDDMTITATIILMAHQLGFKVLAEGVETQQQLNFLKEQHCDLYQGYFYSKALSAEDFVNLQKRSIY